MGEGWGWEWGGVGSRSEMRGGVGSGMGWGVGVREIQSNKDFTLQWNLSILDTSGQIKVSWQWLLGLEGGC